MERLSLRCTWSKSWVLAFSCVLMMAAGCGTNIYEQEIQIEAAAIKLVEETLAGGYSLVSTEDLKKLIESHEPLLIVDAMPAVSSYDRAHIPTAVNFEFPKEVISTWDEESMLGRTKEDYESLLGKDKDRPIVVYCGFVTCARSHNAAVFASKLGYTNVKRYPGGIYAWRGAGYPVTSR